MITTRMGECAVHRVTVLSGSVDRLPREVVPRVAVRGKSLCLLTNPGVAR